MLQFHEFSKFNMYVLQKNVKKMVTNYCNCTSLSKLNTYLKNFDKTNNINRVIVTDTFFHFGS